MIVSIIKEKNITILCVEGNVIDDNSLNKLEESFLELYNTKKLLLNLSDMGMATSAALGKMVYLRKKCKENDVVLKLCCMSETTKNVFEITRLNKLFEIYSTQDEAIQTFK